ncbi:MAG: AraC family transcriptional regulator [Myxococcota bacterium]
MKAQPVSRWRDEAIRGEFLWASGVAPPLPMHHHPTLQVGVVVKGVLDVAIAGGFEGRMAAPTLITVPARVPHRVSGVPGSEVEYAQVELPPEENPFMRCASVHEGLVVATRDERACHCFLELLHASDGERPAAERSKLLEATADALLAAEVAELGGRMSHPLVSRVLARLDRTTDRVLTLSELIRSERVSRSTLLRTFRREFGGSPHDYHVSVRRNLAFELIDRGRSVAEASLEAGFHDQSHFTRHARTILAMGPVSWRRRRRVR